MNKTTLPILLLCIASMVHSDSATQTDWSGGPDVEGPVTDWGESFYRATDCDWESAPGFLSLAIEDVKHLLEDDQQVMDLCAADIDGDGDNDVIGSGWTLCWWENAPETADPWIKQVIQDPLYASPCLHCSDIDLDGDIDIVTGESSQVNWWENTDGTGDNWVKHLVTGGMNHTADIQAVDLDGDEDTDIVTAEDEALDQAIKVWLNVDGSGGSWQQVSLPENLEVSCCLYCADIDSDGDMDIVSGDWYGDSVYWWENLQEQGWVRHAVNSSPLSGVTAVFAADIEGDGSMDIVASDFGRLVWWDNLNGMGTAWQERMIDYIYCASKLCGCDYDGDGDTDLMAVLWEDYAPQIIVWYERTAYSFTMRFLDDFYYYARAMCTADISGDGKADVVTSISSAYNDIDWWDLRVFETGYLESSILDVGCEPVWDMLEATIIAPEPCTVYFLLQAYDTPDASDAFWSEPLYPPCSISGVIPDGYGYVKYLVHMETDNPLASPQLGSVTISWDPLGIGDGFEPAGFELYPFSPNPSHGSALIMFGLQEQAVVSLSVFDLSGRTVLLGSGTEYGPGQHSIQTDDLQPGVYECRMISGDFSATRRFIVIE